MSDRQIPDWLLVQSLLMAFAFVVVLIATLYSTLEQSGASAEDLEVVGLGMQVMLMPFVGWGAYLVQGWYGGSETLNQIVHAGGYGLFALSYATADHIETAAGTSLRFTMATAFFALALMYMIFASGAVEKVARRVKA